MPGFSTPGREDEEKTVQALERMGIRHLENEIYTEISGGERQLALIARALAQQARFILMDEPASSLDYGNQMRLLREIRNLAKEGAGVCFTAHYPDHAFLTQSSVLALEQKDRWKKGPAQEVITEELLKSMYKLDAKIRSYKDGDRVMRQVTARID